MSDTSAAASPPDLEPDRSELASLLRLSVPLVASQVGFQLMGFLDTAMVGRISPAALGGVGIGGAVFFAISVIGMGSVLGMDPLVAQAIGAGERERARKILWQGVRVALGMSLPVMMVLAVASLGLERLGVEAETASEARRFMLARLPGVIPFLVFSAVRSYLQAAGGARSIVLAMIGANIINVIGNVLLIFGDRSLVAIGLPAVGLPALGVVGSGLSSSLASFVTVGVAALGVRAIDASQDPSRRASDPELLGKILKLGAPIGLQLFAEVGAFTIASILAGRMGKAAAAGFQVAISLVAVTFTFMLGLSSATAVRVGQAVGRGDTPGARRAGFTALKTSLVFMSLTAVLFLSAPEALARILTDKAVAVTAAIPLIQIAGVFQLSDGAQVVAGGALRGTGDTKSAQIASVVGYYALGLPIAAALGFGLDMGAPGIWWGLSVSLTFVAVSLTIKFHRASKATLVRV